MRGRKRGEVNPEVRILSYVFLPLLHGFLWKQKQKLGHEQPRIHLHFKFTA